MNEKVSNIKLSICIPTYNRASFIGSAIESVIFQANEQVEIVISDNASSDNTESIVDYYKKSFPNITYHRWEKNMGADMNYIKTIDLASGEYCWFLGSDDIIEKDGIQTVMNALSKHAGLSGLSVNYNAYDLEMKNRLPVISPPGDGLLKSDTLLRDADEICGILGGYFGYISGQIVCRKKWNKFAGAPGIEKYFNAYVHIYIIFCMLIRDPNWLYINKNCVGWRVGNDSFLSAGQYKRLEIDVIGYEKIAKDTFGKKSRGYKKLMKVIAYNHAYYAIMSTTISRAGFAFYPRAFILCVRYYWKYPYFWIITIPWFLIIPGLFIRLYSYVRLNGISQLIKKAKKIVLNRFPIFMEKEKSKL